MEQFPEEFRQYDPIQPRGTDWRAIGRKIWAPVAAVGAFVVKFGAVLYKIKFIGVAASMVISIGAYALLFGWWFAAGFVLLIFVHEMGHVLELRRQGVPASAPLFIPFLGAFVGMKQLPANAWKEAQVALAGPIVGSLGAAVVWAIGKALDSRLLVALAFAGFFINLFNLLPVIPLDGGRAVGALHPAIWLVGLLALVALAVFRHNPILYIIILLGGMEMWRRWQMRHHPESQAYYRVRPWQRGAVAVTYLGLAAGLVFAMEATHIPH
jgi:Zn-dependent protease